MAVKVLLEGEAEELTRNCTELAKEGDTTALRLCMERLAPATKSRALQLPMPTTESAGHVLKAQAAGNRQDPLDEAATIAGVLEAKRKASRRCS
jgi:hypothetical protein